MSVKLMTNLLVYRVTSDWRRLHDSAQITEALATRPARLPSATELNAVGFSEICNEEDNFYERVSANTHRFAVNFADRMLPGKIVRQRMLAAVHRIESDEDRKVFAREKNQIKDKIVLEMLPKAFIDQKIINVVVQGPLIIIDSTSAKKGEDILCLLREVLGTLNVRPMAVKGTPIQSFTEWFTRAEVGDGEAFSLTGDFKAISSDDDIDSLDGKGTSPKAEGLSDLVLEHGRRVTMLGLNWNTEDGEVVSFKVNEMLGIKGIKWPESIADMAAENCGEDKGDPATYMRATFLLLTSDIANLLAALLDELGGEDLPDNADTLTPAEAQALADIQQRLTDLRISAANPQEGGDDYLDDLYTQAEAYVLETGKVSISALQRKLKIGYNRAANLIERLETEGVVTEMSSNGSREVIRNSKRFSEGAELLADIGAPTKAELLGEPETDDDEYEDLL